MNLPVPSEEEIRLLALARYEVFGTTPEPEFDRLTALAARLFRVPVALISLIGEKEHWLKSHHGSDHQPLERDLTFCVHALFRTEVEGVLVIPDTRLDLRSADNPAVTGVPYVRFYAGAPLRTREGQVLGTFCLTDTVPRDFPEAEQAMLIALAATAMDLLELRLSARHLHAEILERQRVGDALRQGERTLRQIAANAPGMVYQFLWKGVGDFSFPFVGEGCRQFFGAGPEEIYARPTLIWEVLKPGDIQTMRLAIADSAQTLQPCHFELPYRAPDGTTRWMEGVSRPQRVEGGTLWNGVLLDVTDRKLSQQRLEETNTLLSAIINGTTDAIFIRDMESRYLMINPAGAAFLGAVPEEVVGRTDDRFFPPENARKNREHDRRVVESGRALTYEDQDTLHGERRSFLSTKTPFRDAQGNLIGVIGIARDISELRRATEELQTAKEEAERANNAKSEFLSRMSHELRTPLNAILGFGQLLEMHGPGDGNEESVTHILKAGRHLLNLIDEVLALSRIETGRLRLSLEPVLLQEVTAECLSLVGQMAGERTLQCVDECQPENGSGPGTYLLADRQRLRQVLLNLLTNAIKYNQPGGSIRLSCARLPPVGGDEHARGRLRLSVADTGVGLSEAELARLFTPFDRLKAEHTRTEGTGLGLTLSKGLIEAMGGRIGVESVLGEGSTFWIELPLAEDPRHAAESHRRVQPAPAENSCRGTVLHIEDNLTNARLLEMLLEDFPGVELLGAEQGSLGLDLARSHRPDLILLDLHLPDLPGWEVLAALQADPETRDIPVVIVSADATPNQIARLRLAGACEYLTKPLNVSRMVALFHEHLQGCGQASAV